MPEQMSSLWQIFSGQRKREGKEAESKWGQLRKDSKGSRCNLRTVQNRCLEVALLGQDNQSWDDVIATSSTSLSDVKTQRVTDDWKYAGELEKLHGRREAKDFIRQGKYEEGKDKDGTVWYRKRSVGSSHTSELRQATAVSKSKTYDNDEEAADIEKLMLEKYDAADLLGIVMGGGEKKKDTKGDKQKAAILDGTVDGQSDKGGDDEGDESELGEEELLAKVVATGKQQITSLDKQCVALLSDVNAVAALAAKPRTEGLVKAAKDHKKVMETHKRKLQGAVTKAEACQSEIEDMITTADKYIEEAKDIHNEFKPHIKARK